MRKYYFLVFILFVFINKSKAQEWIKCESVSIIASHPFGLLDGAQGSYLKNTLQFSIKSVFLIEAGYGILNSYDELAFDRGIYALHANTFSIAAFLQPLNEELIKFNIGGGIMRMRYHSYFADAFGSMYSSNRDVILQHVINTYDWKFAYELSGNLLVRIYKNVYGGGQFSYVHILGELEPFTPEGFFNAGVQLRYYFK